MACNFYLLLAGWYVDDETAALAETREDISLFALNLFTDSQNLLNTPLRVVEKWTRLPKLFSAFLFIHV